MYGVDEIQSEAEFAAVDDVITLQRAAERHHERVREQEDWLTFHPRSLSDGFGPLEALREGRLAPRAASAQPLEDAEFLTYVREGTLGYEDATGRTGILHAGEFQHLTGGGTLRYSEANLSPTHWAHVFHIRLRPTKDPHAPGYEQKRFSASQRRGILCIVASPDGRLGSLRLHQDAALYSMLLDPGQHLMHPLAPNRGAWLHVVKGRVTLGADELGAGDGAGIVGERVLSLTATDDTEILILDVLVADSNLHRFDGLTHQDD